MCVCVCVCVCVCFAEAEKAAARSAGLSVQGQVQLLAFCVFEVIVGIFWPSMMTMRAHYVPEELRSTIINFFRIPLNLFVCIILYNVSGFGIHTHTHTHTERKHRGLHACAYTAIHASETPSGAQKKAEIRP